MQNELDELFNRQPPYTDSDLDRVIVHMRELRAQYDSTGRGPKKASGPKAQTLNLAELGLSKPKPTGKIVL